MGMSSGDQNSFFLEMESRFTAILKILGDCTTGETEMEATAAGLQETIGIMRDSIEEIRGIEIRIHRTATNATVRANRKPACVSTTRRPRSPAANRGRTSSPARAPRAR